MFCEFSDEQDSTPDEYAHLPKRQRADLLPIGDFAQTRTFRPRERKILPPGKTGRYVFVRHSVPARQVLIATPDRDQRAHRGLRLTNTSGRPLYSGVAAIRLATSAETLMYAGQSEIPEVPPGEDCLLPFEVIDGLRVTTIVDSSSKALLSVSGPRMTTQYRRSVTYRVERTEADIGGTLIIEHQPNAGFQSLSCTHPASRVETIGATPCVCIELPSEGRFDLTVEESGLKESIVPRHDQEAVEKLLAELCRDPRKAHGASAAAVADVAGRLEQARGRLTQRKQRLDLLEQGAPVLAAVVAHAAEGDGRMYRDALRQMGDSVRELVENGEQDASSEVGRLSAELRTALDSMFLERD
jgi:hypothetical protein